MSNCSVVGCKRRSGTSSLQKDGITFHRFPKNPEIWKKWVIACNRDISWKPTRSSSICSRHFEEAQFQNLLNRRRKLVHSAVPTLFLSSYRLFLNSGPISKKIKHTDDSECNENCSDTEDENDTWAKKCAHELSQMEPDQENFAKRAITYILMEGRLGLLHKNSVQVNNKFIDEQTIQEDLNSSPLDDYLVIRSGSATSEPSSSSQSLVDTGTSSKSRAKAKSLNKTIAPNFVTESCKTTTSVGISCNSATSVGSSSYPGTSFVVTSHKTMPVGTSSSQVKTIPSHDPGPLVVAACQKILTSDGSSIYIKSESETFDTITSDSNEVVASFDSSNLLVKAEPCDDTGTFSLSVSHETPPPVRRSPSLVKSEPNSPPPSSPDFMVIVKEEPE